MSERWQAPKRAAARRELVCHFCGRLLGKGDRWRSPITDCPGGFWCVCGPLCPERPPTARVVDMGAVS